MIPPDIFLMMKGFSTVEGVALMLDPNFNMIAEIAPFIERVKLERFYPERMARDVSRMVSDLFQFMRQFPKEMLEISRLTRQKKLIFRFENQGLQVTLAAHDRIGNRISLSIVIAALIIGSSLIFVAEIPPLLFGLSLIGIVLFFAASVMGTWLLIAILKRGGLK